MIKKKNFVKEKEQQEMVYNWLNFVLDKKVLHSNQR